MKTLPLTNTDKICLVDDEDYQLALKHSECWSLNQNCQVQAWSSIFKCHILLSRLIMGVDSIKLVDHRNRNRLDNQRNNLRQCTAGQNNSNRPSSALSGFKGVYFNKANGKWRALITPNGKRTKHIGYFMTAEEAAMAYDEKAKELFGEFAYLNFPISAPQQAAQTT